MEETQECPVCGHINPITATLCQNLSCQMVLSIKTIPISYSETRKTAPKIDSSSLRNTVFLHVEGSTEPLEVQLIDGIEMVIGRHDPTNVSSYFVDLGSYEAINKGVSRKHAALLFQNGRLKLADLGSLNSTYLNGDPIEPHQPRSLHDGDVVTLGGLSLTVRFE